MAQFGFPKLKIEIDKAAGTLVDISSYVTAFGGWSKERLIEELTAAGDSVDRWGDIGFTQKGEVVLSGPYDDTADGLLDVLKAWTDGSQRTLQMTFDVGTASDVETVECLLSKVERTSQRGALTQIHATLRPTGAVS